MYLQLYHSNCNTKMKIKFINIITIITLELNNINKVFKFSDKNLKISYIFFLRINIHHNI
jgi:hypothetical protein